MTVTAIHQFLPSFALRDAIGGHARQVQRALRELGFESEIYAQHLQPETRTAAHLFEDFGAATRENTVLLYHSSTGSPMASWLIARSEPLVVWHHNITPPEFFAGWEPTVAAELQRGRVDLRELASRTMMGIADSAYNAGELEDLGYRKCTVVPILIDQRDFAHEVDPIAAERLQRDKADGGADVLFVGRIAPNKCQHDLIKTLMAYRSAYDPNARLRLVGGSSSHAYETALRTYADALGLANAVDFAGSVSNGELAAYYQSADVFLCLSEHEGFCVPLIEAMTHEVPVVAFEAAAVPETVGDGGVLLASKVPSFAAAAVRRVIGDRALRTQVVAQGRLGCDRYSLREGRRQLGLAVETLVELAG